MRKLYMLAAGLLLVLFSWAQQGKIRCYSDEYLREQIRQHPERGRSLELLEQEVGKYVEARLNARNGTANKGKPGSGGGGGGGGTTPRSTVVYVPVVVHVVYNTQIQNISDAQIASQMEVLNDDFRKANVELSSGAHLAGYENLVADALIQFCLVETRRVPTTVTSFGTNDAIKRSSAGGSDPVDPATKLNIWVGNISGGILGYAQFPGGTLSTDGVVVLYNAFGTSTAGATAAPYNEGRTATHEVGHWFGLRHIWGDRRCGDDLVGDTPAHDGANYGCLGSGVSVGLTSQCSNRPLEMWMNYMDYTDDACMYMFSNGQKLRMDGFIAASRAPYCLNACPAGTIT
nr:zinc metalloprotease [Chitinophagaceae bacterium]